MTPFVHPLRVVQVLTIAVLSVAGPMVSAFGSLLFEASLRNGNYGAGTAVNTLPPNHGGSPGVLGIVNSPDGVTFTSTEANGRSNALINWQIGAGASNPTFRRTGTVSFWFKADRVTHIGGSILGDNYGFGQFHNGQGTFGVGTGRKVNGTGTADDQVTMGWSTWHNDVWYDHTASQFPVLEYDRWYDVGFAWGGSEYNFEIWVDGLRVVAHNLPGGVTFPWGSDGFPSAFNFGLGDNHERGYDPYNSAAGVTFADIRIWNEYRAQGDTASPDIDGDGVPAAQGDCDDNDPNVHPGAVELCNGTDDDCDSITDEGFAVGALCTAGTGACEQSGQLVCAADFLATECDATPGTPNLETCNGIDDDCNGLADDGGVCVVHDLAVVDIGVPRTVTLTNRKPVQTWPVKVQIQNRSPHPETITDVSMLGNLVSLGVYSLDTWLCLDPVVSLASAQKAFPATLKPKQKLTVNFEVTFACAVDAAKSTKKDPEHDDYRYEAAVDHSALDGEADTHVVDNVCPRAAVGTDPWPDGKIEDKGCDETMTDMVVK